MQWGTELSEEHRTYSNFPGSCSETYKTELWVPLGATATFGSILGRYKQKGQRFEFLVLDTYPNEGEISEAQTCTES